MEPIYITAMLIGLLGSTHCIGMCGGIVGALSAGQGQPQRSASSQMAHHLTYNGGRIVSYTFAGAIAGLAGSLASNLPLDFIVPFGRIFAGLLMIALGLYLAGWWHAIAVLEKAGYQVWKRIEPMGRRFLPANTPGRAFGLGLVWGWLPCGLVYSALALSMISMSVREGALIMLAFGLGTLPSLLVLGGAAKYVSSLAQRPVMRRIAGAVVVLIGVYSIVIAFSGHDHEHAAVIRTPGDQPHTH